MLSSKHSSLLPPGEASARKGFWLLCAVLFVAMMWMVPQFGNSGDEIFQWMYGRMVYNYFATFGHNREVFDSPASQIWMLRNYGGFFDLIVTILNKIVHPKDEYLLRHYLNALFAFPAFVFAGLLAKEVTGRWRTAIIALIFLVLTPRFWGECFNNPKDVPFAMSALFFSWALVRWLKGVGHPAKKDTVLVALSIALGISARPGGVLFITYFLFFAALYSHRQKLWAQWKPLGVHLAIACAAGYLGGCLFWPYALENPVLHPFRALKLMAKYPISIRLLFEGKFEYIANLPWYYGSKMVVITTPFIFLAGALLSAILALSAKVGSSYRKYVPVLLFMILFPFLFMLARGSALYDGVRHLLFIIVTITVCAAIGMDELVFRLKGQKIFGTIIPIITLLLLLSPARFMARNHPYEYLYFNELVGGLPGAYTYYETDYYMHTPKEAYHWLLEHEGKAIFHAKDSLTLSTSCSAEVNYNFIHVHPAPFKVIDEGFATQNRSNWDYGIFISRYLDGPAMRSGYWAEPSKIIHTIYADGVPICIILKNDSLRYGYKAWAAQEGGDYRTSANYGIKAVGQYPKDLEAWSNLARAYLGLNRLDSAQWASDHALALSGDNNVSVYYAGEIAFRQEDYRRALSIYQKFLKRYPKLSMTWLGIAQAQGLMGNLPAAEKSFWTGYRIDVGDQYRIYKVLAILAHRKGYPLQNQFFEQLATRNYNP